MTQRQLQHAPGDLPICSACSDLRHNRLVHPRHFVDLRAARAGGGHFLECSRCDRRTAKYPDLGSALRDWHRLAPPPAAATEGAVRSIAPGARKLSCP